MAVDYSKFYLLDDPLATRPLRLESTYPNLTNEQVWQLFLGQWKPESPIQLVAFQGGQATDFLWSSDFFIICISSRVVALLTEQGFTGWATYPVEVYGRKRERLPDYHGFSVVAECRQDLSRSPIIDDPEVPGRKVYKGLYFDEHQWDGSDFFRISGTALIIVTDRVYRLLKRSRVSNVHFKPLPEVMRNVRDVRRGDV